jgi:hypothetical protein
MAGSDSRVRTNDNRRPPAVLRSDRPVRSISAGVPVADRRRPGGHPHDVPSRARRPPLIVQIEGARLEVRSGEPTISDTSFRDDPKTLNNLLEDPNKLDAALAVGTAAVTAVTPRYCAVFRTRSPLPLMRPCNPGGSSPASAQDTAALLPCTPVKPARTFGHALIDRFPRLQIYSARSRSDRPSRQPDRPTTRRSQCPNALVPQRSERATTIRDNRLGEVDRWPVRCR